MLQPAIVDLSKNQPGLQRYLFIAEFLLGGFLIWLSLTPFQNYEQAARIAVEGSVLWLAAILFYRSRNLFRMRLFFYFAVLFAFYLRLGMLEGWLHNFFLVTFFAQWVSLLLLLQHYPEDSSGSSLFLTLSLISPLFCEILEDPRYRTMVGVALWMLPLAHACVQLQVSRLPRLMIALVAWCLLSSPLTLYSWSNLTFAIILLACVLLYLACREQALKSVFPLKVAYILAAAFLALFAVSREIHLLRLGRSVLEQRHYLIEHPNTAGPFLIILAAFLLEFLEAARSVAYRIYSYAGLGFVTTLIILTYSRASWIGMAVMILAVFLQQKAAKFRRILFTLLIVVPLVFLIALHGRIAQRILSGENVSDRANNWIVSLRAIEKAPVFGYGWLNYYQHATLTRSQSAFESLRRNSELVAVHAHSMPLDLAETAGIPFSLFFIAIVVLHFPSARSRPALFAGILGVTVNSLLDTAAFWLTVFPHFWVLLALASGSDVSVPHRKAIRFLPVVLLVFAASMLLEDRFLLLNDFYLKKGQTDNAEQSAKTAKVFGPLDTLPLVRLKDVSLSKKDVSSAIGILNSLKNLKKNYAPYWSESGRLQKRRDLLEKARALDPYTMLQEPTYLEMALLADRQASADLYKYLMYQIRWFDVRSRELIDQIPEKKFINDALLFAKQNSVTQDDEFTALDHFVLSLLHLRKEAAAARLLEQLLLQEKSMDPGWRDYFLRLLMNAYRQSNQADKIAGLTKFCTRDECVILTRLASAITNRDKVSALMLLQTAQSKFAYEDLAPQLEDFYSVFKEPQEGIRNYELMRWLPNFSAPDTEWLRKIAEIYYEKKDFENAARTYHEATFEQYNSPQFHWWEARCWFLAGDASRATAANMRLLRLIPSSWFLSNLYRTRISGSVSPAHLELYFNENETGGGNWQTIVFAHAPSRIEFGNEARASDIHGEVKLIWGAALEKTDGVEFRMQNDKGAVLFSDIVDADHPARRFDWTSKNETHAVVFETLPRENPNFDWAAWVIPVTP